MCVDSFLLLSASQKMNRRHLDPPPFTAEQQRYYSSNTNPPSSPPQSIITITVLVLGAAVLLSASFYLLFRFLFRRSSTPSISLLQNTRRVSPATETKPSPDSNANSLIESLPLFAFDSLSSSAAAAGDCAVCLSKFEPKDILRLLPLCCHAFHRQCIDTWLAGNLSCPLCRSQISLPENQLLAKSSSNSLSSSSDTVSRSFRVEIGNVSRRGGSGGLPPNTSGEIRRSYSIGGSFDYVLDAAVSEVSVGSFGRHSEFKMEPQVTAEELTEEVGRRGGGGWLKEYLSYSLSSSRTMSFRGSGRLFFGTSGSRRSASEIPARRGAEVEVVDLEASRLSEEIGELFRWFSGV